MIKSTILEFLSNFYILCMRGAKAKLTFRALILNSETFYNLEQNLKKAKITTLHISERN